MNGTSKNGSGDESNDPFDKAFGSVRRPDSPADQPPPPRVVTFQPPVPREEPASPKVRKPRNRGRRLLAVVVVLAIFVGIGYVKRGPLGLSSVFDRILGNGPNTAQAAPQQTTPKSAGWQCNKWAPPKPATDLIGKAKQPLAAGVLKTRQDVVQQAVKTATGLTVTTHATRSAAVVTGCGSAQISTASAGDVNGHAPNVETTLYDLASVTKSFIATTILMLKNEGKLRMSDKVGTYLPGWKTGQKATVTIQMLLQHTSGLAAEDESDLNAEYAGVIGNEKTPEAIEANVANVPLDHSPGTFAYSNLGYVTLYLIGNKVTGGKVNRYMHAKLFAPLGMNNTVYLPGKSRECAPTQLYADGKTVTCRVRDLLAYKTGGVTGHAGLFSSAGDVARFAAMLASGGQLGGKRFLTPADIKLMSSPVKSSKYGYSTGMWTNKANRWGSQMGKTAFGGYGDTGVAFAVDPVTGYWVVFLNNSSPTKGRAGDLKEALIKKEIKAINTAAVGAANKAP